MSAPWYFDTAKKQATEAIYSPSTTNHKNSAQPWMDSCFRRNPLVRSIYPKVESIICRPARHSCESRNLDVGCIYFVSPLLRWNEEKNKYHQQNNYFFIFCKRKLTKCIFALIWFLPFFKKGSAEERGEGFIFSRKFITFFLRLATCLTPRRYLSMILRHFS